ncbi:B3 domain-containing protein [Actinidia chinensis var. chinensis]|uniref:B3 domain-containing protein n=1 Tax=Actinidia chinensis var. chinensis TaxID=1590841 RepID=A0A2R6P6R9_ACTCC|nr:B3 domain-containing protein [Actinidia chinensis var. chinensis]
MSENRDKGKGAEDKEGKRLEDMKVQQEAEMEKAKDASKGGISSSSTPLKETATDTKSGISIKGIPSSIMEKMIEKMLGKPTGEITKSEPGESSWSRRPGKEILQETDPINKRDSGSRRKIFLFEKHLTASDVEHGVLTIPVELALDRFPPLPETRLDTFETKIEVTDAQGHSSIMGIVYDHANSLFLIDSGWRGLAEHHGLRAMDRVRFYIPIPCLKENDYLIEYVRTDEFREGNLLFEKELTCDEANYSKWLTFPPHLEGRFPFPGYRIYHVERLCFTDAVNKDWWFTLQFQNGTYCVMSGWEGFRNEYKLEEGDVIKFYKAVWPRSSQHFLIQHVTRDEAAGTGMKNDGCIPTISGMKKHGRGGGRGQNGKKFGVGDCCLAWQERNLTKMNR